MDNRPSPFHYTVNGMVAKEQFLAKVAINTKVSIVVRV